MFDTATETTSFRARAGRSLAKNWALAFLILMILSFGITAGSSFFSTTNFQNIIHLSITGFLLAMAETFVIITGGIDLSIGFIMGLSSVFSAIVMQKLIQAGLPTGAVIGLGSLAGILVSLIPGLLNGLIVSRLNVPPFIVTMGMWGICAGVTLKLCDGLPISGLPDALTRIGNGYLLYIDPGKSASFFQKPDYFPEERIRDLVRLIPLSFFFIILCVLVLWFVLSRMRFGRHTYAIGGSMDASIRSGINVKRHLTLVYLLAGLLAGLAGVFNVFQTGIGNYTTFNAMYELFAVAAVVIGGASLMGGKGSLIGSIIGVLVLAVLENGLDISGILPFYRYIAVGVLLTIAVVIDQIFPELF